MKKIKILSFVIIAYVVFLSLGGCGGGGGGGGGDITNDTQNDVLLWDSGKWDEKKWGE